MADKVEEMVRGVIAGLVGNSPADLKPDDILVGQGALLKSRDLVMLMLDIEDFLQNEYNVELNWTSDSAMSGARSRLRSVGSLIELVRERANGGA